MERLPYRDVEGEVTTLAAARETDRVESSDWRLGLPVMTSAHVSVRELRMEDAASLLMMIAAEEVARFISPPPTTLDGFERFIAWAARERATGTYACFAIVPAGGDTAVGLLQVRQLDADFATAEWGFAIGSPFWGRGLFAEAAALVLDFAFQTLHVHRLEARASVENERGNGALRKIGATPEGVLRKSFLRNGRYHDQMLWSVLDTDWLQTKAVWGGKLHVH